MRRFIAALVLTLIATAASAQDSPANIAAGRQVVSKMCLGCHAERELGRTKGGAPTFAAMAADPTVSEISLRVFLQTAHVKMPNLILTESETNDVIGYILSFRER
jgi:mono/diheme cytochrome c family protein